MDDSPRISVVVPFFNSERTVEACIDSLQNQEGVGGPYELIFVKNGSVDATAVIVERTPGLIVLNEDTPGPYAARNTGIARATAPLIAFTDADCTVDANWLRSIQDSMEDPSVAILVGHFRYPPRASLALRILGAYENAKTRYVLDQCAPAQHFAHANNMAVRASLFEEIGLFKEWGRAADTEFVHRGALRRPDLRVVYGGDTGITHLEFVSARARVRRLSLYARTNSKIDTFRELDPWQRLVVVAQMLRRLRQPEQAVVKA